MNNEIKDKFDIVFVSSDKDQDAFNEYFKEMPWKALPYSGMRSLYSVLLVEKKEKRTHSLCFSYHLFSFI